MSRSTARDLVACTVGAIVCAGMGPARAQIHGASDPAADAVGLLVAAILVVLALAMLARTYPKRRSR